MAIRHNSLTPPWSALLFALMGLLWCGYVVFPSGAQEPCVMSGCAVSKELMLGDLSLWWIGGAYFFLLMIICLRGKRHIAWRLAQIALVLDSILLLVMFFTGPCSDCLVVALFFFLTARALRPTVAGGYASSDAPTHFFMFPLWVGLFLGNVVMAGNEAIPNWTIGKEASQNVRLYFSPSCPACRDAVVALGDTVTLFPVAKEKSDFDAIIRFYSNMNQGIPAAESLRQAMAEGAPEPRLSLSDRFLLNIQLFRNKTAVLKHSSSQPMPLILINGMPSSWKKTDDQSLGTDNGNGMSYSIDGRAGQGNATPRSENSNASGRPSAEGMPWEGDTTFGQCEGSVPCPE